MRRSILFSSLRTSIDVHTQTKIDVFFGAMWSFHNQISMSKTLLERVSGAFVELPSTKYIRGAENCRNS